MEDDHDREVDETVLEPAVLELVMRELRKQLALELSLLVAAE